MVGVHSVGTTVAASVGGVVAVIMMIMAVADGLGSPGVVAVSGRAVDGIAEGGIAVGAVVGCSISPDNGRLQLITVKDIAIAQRRYRLFSILPSSTYLVMWSASTGFDGIAASGNM
jgi:hypothetical protein